MQKNVNQNNQPKNQFSQMEEEVLGFWEKSNTFEKSVNKEATQGDYVFYDGPPFATGLPHYGHIVASIIKDVVPRYQTMKGHRVERRWGWDCHGLPIENIVEKELGSKSKKDIEETGVAKFNELCRSKVTSYVEDWKKVINKLGRWADMENAYMTMDLGYMESVWAVFKEIYDKGLIYEGYRSMHICPRCETTLSQSEVAEGYKDVKDLSCIAKFELVDPSFAEASDGKVFVLAWTTTPWTLIGNVALAVGKDIEYVKINYQGLHGSVVLPYEKGIYILAKDIVWDNLKGNCNKGIKEFINVVIASANIVTTNKDQVDGVLDSFRGISEKYGNLESKVKEEKVKNYFFENYSEKYGFEVISSRDLVGKKYKPLFNYYSSDENLENRENGWKIYAGDFVTTNEGTGIVHIAPAFGDDDMRLGKEYNLPFVQHVNMDGYFKSEIKDFVGLNVKPIEDHMSTDIEIIKYLAHNNLLFSKEKYEHSYPHCWRCDTPLLNYATSSWFINITKIKTDLLKNAEDINWSPEHIKAGRFGKWLEGARDWSISRQRFWASVMPIWKCECGEIKVLGSVDELEKLSGQKVTDIHKHIVDEITFPCEKCGGVMKRIPDVLDTWFDSGSMPYAQMHYPFENKEKFENNFPAEFIAEGADQTRCWFYYLHVLSTGTKQTKAFKNVIVNGIVLAKDGKKMSKKLQNYPDPMDVFNKYGADALRYYLLTSPVMLADTLCFAEKGVEESLRKVNMILWNVYKFYEMFANTLPSSSAEATEDKQSSPSQGEGEFNIFESNNILDKWILLKLDELIKTVTESMDKYNLPQASRPITLFIDDFSTWYLRRSRDRFKNEDEKDKNSALNTTKFVLIQLAKVMAPFVPFIAEQIWQKVTGNNFQDENKSVHLEVWPKQLAIKNYELRIIEEMVMVRKIVELGLAKRDEAGIKVRQPLNQLSIINYQLSNNEYEKLILDELNVKKVVCQKGEGELAVELDTEISDELKLEGIKRDLVRVINNLRKDQGLTINDYIVLYYQTDNEEISKTIALFKKDLLKDVLASDIIEKKLENSKEFKINDSVIGLSIES